MVYKLEKLSFDLKKILKKKSYFSAFEKNQFLPDNIISV